ncbi:MAG TPA: hypothetical protein VI976_03395 [Candidatus Omnitrophota bacterium]|nr:hypothetical protein [Candidatus Omnitrophota bacterium]
MLKRTAVVSILIIFVFLSAGCETTKGIAKGVIEGVPRDAKNTWQAMLKADDWMKKNMW